MEDCNLVMFTHAINIFEECTSLKKSIPKDFFTSLLNDLLTKDLVTFSNLVLVEFMKPKRGLYATPSM
jgi:hypothetical protein